VLHKKQRSIQSTQLYESHIMKTYEQLMAAYERAATALHKTKPMTAKAAAAAKRLEKTVENLEMWRAAQ
jgi:hypothetical protein